MTVVRIPKSQLRKGMYVESVEGTQFVFAKRRFLLDLDEDVRAIAAAPVEFVLVNKARSKVGLVGEQPAASPALVAKTEEAVVRSRAAIRDGLFGFAAGEARDISAFRPVARDLVATMAEGPAILLELTRLKSKDEGTFMHSLAVGALMSGVGKAQGYDADTVETLGIAGILHDFGKLLIPNVILNKRGPLTAAEREVVRNHPTIGYHRLSTYPDMPDMVLDVCRYHHEVLDGSGYPLGLQGAQISEFVRISTICDIFDALTSKRPYKEPWRAADAISWMFKQEALFDRKLVVSLGDVVDFAP